MKNLFLKRSLYFIAIILSFSSLQATIQEGSVWSFAGFYGHLPHDKKIKYLFTAESRNTYHPHKINQALLQAGIGYRQSKKVTYFTGYLFFLDRDECETEQENRLWQEIVVTAREDKKVDLAFRTRLEQRKRICEPEWALRFREKMILQLPHTFGKKGTFVLTEEIILHFVKPCWVEHVPIDQNRIYMGARFQITKRGTFEFGYMNQYKWRKPENESNNILYLSLKITLG